MVKQMQKQILNLIEESTDIPCEDIDNINNNDGDIKLTLILITKMI